MRTWRSRLGYVALLAAFAALPFAADKYWTSIGARAAVYWVLVSGLNLVVGYAGQLAIGYVSILAVGAYAFCALTAKFNASVPAALLGAIFLGALSGVVVGLPALRLRTFYFAMTTLGFATIVTQIALAWTDVTGGGIGLPAPDLPAPFDTALGFYFLCLGTAAVCTWMTANLGAGRYGRAMQGLRLRDRGGSGSRCAVARGRRMQSRQCRAAPREPGTRRWAAPWLTALPAYRPPT